LPTAAGGYSKESEVTVTKELATKSLTRRSRNRTEVPSSAEEGCLRHQENGSVPWIRRRRGGVGQPPIYSVDQHHAVRSDKGGFATLRDIFLMSRPPLLG